MSHTAVTSNRRVGRIEARHGERTVKANYKTRGSWIGGPSKTSHPWVALEYTVKVNIWYPYRLEMYSAASDKPIEKLGYRNVTYFGQPWKVQRALSCLASLFLLVLDRCLSEEFISLHLQHMVKCCKSMSSQTLSSLLQSRSYRPGSPIYRELFIEIRSTKTGARREGGSSFTKKHHLHMYVSILRHRRNVVKGVRLFIKTKFRGREGERCQGPLQGS